MIKIEINDGKATIALKGSRLQCEYEFYTVGSKLTEENKNLASMFILGMADHLPKEEMQKMVDAAYASKNSPIGILTKIIREVAEEIKKEKEKEKEQQNENR